MYKVLLVVALWVVLCQASPLSSDEGSALVQEQAQQNYDHHQNAIQKQGYNADNSYGITFDNLDKEHRDRGYGYEKAYAYSRETAFFDFNDDKGALNAKDIVEKYGADKQE